MTISAQASDARGRVRQGVVGQLVYSTTLTALLTALNDDPQAVQIDDETIVAANEETYTVTVNGVSASFLSDAAATTQEIVEGLRLAINAQPLMRGVVVPTAQAADVLRLTGRTPGEVYTLAESATGGSITPSSVQAAATADAVPFGRLVIDDELNIDSNVALGKLAKSTAFTAQVVTSVIIFVASATYVYIVKDVAGNVLAHVEIDADTNTATTAAAIIAALNGVLPANSVVVTNPSAGDIVFTAELAGLEFSVAFGTNEEGQVGAAQTSLTETTGPNPLTSVNRAALGVSLHSSNDPAATIGGETGEYAALAGMRLLRGSNAIWVERPGVVNRMQDVYVELDGTGSDAGKFFTADSATRSRLLGVTWLRDGATTTDGVAALDVNFAR